MERFCEGGERMMLKANSAKSVFALRSHECLWHFANTQDVTRKQMNFKAR
jgi:hypothetical protein